MKICFALPSAHIGGFRTFALNLGSAFIRDGHSAAALIVARGKACDDLGDVRSMEKEIAVRLCTQRRVVSRSRFVHRIVGALEEMLPDVLLVNHTLWVQAALPYLDGRIKRMIVVHNTTQEELDLLRGNVEWWDRAVAVGPGVRDELLKRWPQQRVQMIPVGSPEPKAPVRSDFHRKSLHVCYVGRIAQDQKNVMLIGRIAAELLGRGVPFRWLMVGDGPTRAKLEAALEVAGVRGRFDFAGACDQHEVQQLLARQDVLVLPSFSESIGHVLQEAQMLGVVPVATRLEKSTAFVVTDGVDGRLCRSDDAADFAQAIAALHADREQMRRISEAGRRSVRRRFEISTIARQWYELFSGIERQVPARRAILGIYPMSPELMPSRLSTGARLLGRRLRELAE
jgi:glycosyltransferase involved in cell wall biosynthesis